MTWDANGSPIDNFNLEGSSSPPVLGEDLVGLFMAYRQTLLQALSDGDLSKLDAAHGNIKKYLTEDL